MAVKSKTQLQTEINADADLTAGQKIILTDAVDSYQNTFAQLTTTQRNTLTPTIGLIVYNTDTHRYEYWNGAGWFAVGLDTSTPITVKLNISNGQLLEVGGGPVTLIAAPPTGYAIVPLSVCMRVNYIAEEFDFEADGISIVSNARKESYPDRFFTIPNTFINSTAVRFAYAENNGSAATDALVEADALVLLDTNGGPGQGDGSLTLWITYIIIEY